MQLYHRPAHRLNFDRQSASKTGDFTAAQAPAALMINFARILHYHRRRNGSPIHCRHAQFPLPGRYRTMRHPLRFASRK